MIRTQIIFMPENMNPIVLLTASLSLFHFRSNSGRLLLVLYSYLGLNIHSQPCCLPYCEKCSSADQQSERYFKNLLQSGSCLFHQCSFSI